MIRRCRLSQIVDADVRAIPAGGPNGTDMFDVALCAAGIFARSPQRGTSRRRAEPPRTVAQLVALGDPAVSRNSFLIYPWRVLGLPWLHPLDGHVLGEQPGQWWPRVMGAADARHP